MSHGAVSLLVGFGVGVLVGIFVERILEWARSDYDEEDTGAGELKITFVDKMPDDWNVTRIT